MMSCTRVRRVSLAAAAATTAVGLFAGRARAIPAFPGAEGFGGNALTGGLTGDVYHVTSLADTNTPGTLRYGIRESGVPANGRIIVFDVGGTIQLTGSLDIKNVNKLYIAGQTAPSPVTIIGDTTQITSSSGKQTQNVIVRNLAFRKGSGNGSDAVTFAGSGLGTNLILDHVSSSWAEDENLSVANNNTNVTVQYAFNAESLNAADHAFGSLVRPRIDSSVSFHHNLYANNKSRNPRPGTYDEKRLTFDFRNNVVYNWSDRAGYSGGSSEAEREHVDINFVGNYMLAGPSTVANVNYAFMKDKNVELRAYQSGNRIDADRQLNPSGSPNGIDNGWGMWHAIPGTTGTLTQMATPFTVADVTTQTADAAFEQVVNHAGSFWWARDAVDTRTANNVRTNTGAVVTAPGASDWNALVAAPAVTRPANWDTDGDGMPNGWETAMGLNPNVANNRGDFDNDGYSDLEEYINELGAFPAPRAAVFNAAAGRYALSDSWNTRWQPSRFDAVQIAGGTASVDAVGQEAGNVFIGSPGTAGATLEINAGWLRVAGNVAVGSSAADASGSLQLRLNGGKLLVAGTIAGGSGTTNVFAFTGGTLAAGAIDATNLGAAPDATRGTFRQAGGTFAPGDVGAAGRTIVVGSYDVDAGTVAIDLGGAVAAQTAQSAAAGFDNVIVSGTASLGGTLALGRINGYDAAMLTPHVIVDAASIDGHFARVSGHQLSPQKWLAVTYTDTAVLVTATRPGDADVTGNVNFDDLLRLAQNYGLSGTTWASGDFTGEGTTDFGDLLLLAQNYGTPAQFQADWALAQSIVPEPSALLALAAAAALGSRRPPR